jgi:two-component system chemotaxis sensor kinase CheA
MKESEFQKRLQETFALEARENLNAMVACLLELEQRASENPARCIEDIYRCAHSLKGAARAVGNSSIETLCHHMESCFAVMKREQRVPSQEGMDVFHRAVDLLAGLVSGAGEGDAEALHEVKQSLNEVETLLVRHDSSGALDIPAPRPVEEAPAPSPRVESAVLTVPEPSALTAAGTQFRSQVDTVRVPVSALDSLLRQAEELFAKGLEQEGLAPWLQGAVLQLTQAREAAQGALAAGAVQVEPLRKQVLPALDQSMSDIAGARKMLRGAVHQLQQATTRLLGEIRELQLFPFSTLLEQLPRVARDIAREQGKQLQLQMEGGDIGVDRQVLDGLRDPLIHLIRNAIDHGLERPEERIRAGKPPAGTLHIRVAQLHAGAVELLLEDDGRGIELDRVREKAVQLGIATPEEAEAAAPDIVASWIFQSGLSTSNMITDISGRGLGMAIVREKVEALNGAVSCITRPGAGVRFRLHLPVTLAAVRAIEVVAGKLAYFIPTHFIVRALLLRESDIDVNAGRAMLKLDDTFLPVAHLSDVLNHSVAERQREREDTNWMTAVLLEADGETVALQVDKLCGEQEILLKPLGFPLRRVRHVAGAAIRGDGEPVVVLNGADLVRTAVGNVWEVSEPLPEKGTERPAGRVLVADDSLTSRLLLQDILSMAGYTVETAVDGVDALLKLRERPYEALVTDVDMPRMSGFELTSAVRADSKLMHLPVVLVTSLASPEDRARGVEAGANAYIVKSDFDQSNLLEVLGRLV